MRYLRDFWSLIREWFPYILLGVSNLILVLLGVILSLPTIAERIEKTPKYRKWLAAVCLFFGLIGFIYDVSQRHSSDQAYRTLIRNTETMLTKTDTTLKNTAALVTNTNTLVGTISLSVAKLAELQTSVTEINAKMVIAKNDPRVLANLRAQKEAAEKLSKSLQRDLVTSVALRMISQLDALAGSWFAIRENYEAEWREDDYRQFSSRQQREASQKGWTDKIDETDRAYRAQLPNVFAAANSLRMTLLSLLPSARTDEDKRQEAFFSGDFGFPSAIQPGEVREAAEYLDRLLKRVPVPK